MGKERSAAAFQRQTTTQRWNTADRVSKAKYVPWAKEEEEMLARLEVLRLEEHFAPNNWGNMAAHIPGRSSEGCWLRGVAELLPNVETGGFTSGEDQALPFHARICTMAPPEPFSPDTSQCRYISWTKEEDEMLLRLVGQFEPKNWKNISAHMPNRTSKSCRLRWLNQLRPNAMTDNFTSDEEQQDEMLLRLVGQFEPKNWKNIAAHMPDKTSKSCRLRWLNQLRPYAMNGNFTPEEDQIIIQAHAEMGNKWPAIAALLPSRTDNAVKNRWNSALRRRLQGTAAQAKAAQHGAPPQAELQQPQQQEAFAGSNLWPTADAASICSRVMLPSRL